MRTAIAVMALTILGACGGGGTTGTNYSDAPPVAEIVAMPTPQQGSAEAEVAATNAVEPVEAATVVELSPNEADATAELTAPMAN